MPLRAIAYVSEATRNLAAERLQQLVTDAMLFNESVDVTGVLLFDGTRFLQYLEGPEAGVGAAYTRILAASSHNGLVELNRGRVGRRQFRTGACTACAWMSWRWEDRDLRLDRLRAQRLCARARYQCA